MLQKYYKHINFMLQQQILLILVQKYCKIIKKLKEKTEGMW